MDASTEVLAQEVRSRRVAVDNDLELLRVRLQNAGRVDVDYARWARTIGPVVAGLGVVWLWTRRKRSVSSLEGLLVKELSDLYAVEEALVPALVRMSNKATDPEVKQAFAAHRLETLVHVDRLKRVFRSIGARPRGGDPEGVVGVIAEAERLLKRKMDPDVRDAWLIACAQRVEHIEIASYGTARTFAETLAYTHAAQLLQQTLEEEKNTDLKLTQLAERFVNVKSIRG